MQNNFREVFLNEKEEIINEEDIFDKEDEEDILHNIILNNKKQKSILVYCFKYSINNKKILILTDKLDKNNFDCNNFDIIYKKNITKNLKKINNELDYNQYGYIFN